MDNQRVSVDTTFDLVERAKAGDDEALNRLFARYLPSLRRWASGRLPRWSRDLMDTDDLVQDVILLTFESLRAGKVREEERLASFVLGTCRRIVADLRRGAARRERLLERFGAELVPAAGTHDEPSFDLDRLRRCLERLSERERSVVVLSFYAERRSAEIASEVGLSAANVRVVRHRALVRLRGCMETPA